MNLCIKPEKSRLLQCSKWIQYRGILSCKQYFTDLNRILLNLPNIRKKSPLTYPPFNSQYPIKSHMLYLMVFKIKPYVFPVWIRSCFTGFRTTKETLGPGGERRCKKGHLCCQQTERAWKTNLVPKLVNPNTHPPISNIDDANNRCAARKKNDMSTYGLFYIWLDVLNL